MASVSLRLPDEVSDRLQKLVDLTGRSKTSTWSKRSTNTSTISKISILAEQRMVELRAGRSRTYTIEEWSATLAWWIEFEAGAVKDLASIDKPVARRIIAFLRERVANLDDVRSVGVTIRVSKLCKFWKYGVGDCRSVAKIDDQAVCILVVKIGTAERSIDNKAEGSSNVLQNANSITWQEKAYTR